MAQLTYDLDALSNAVLAAVGNTLDPHTSAAEIVNEAYSWFYNCHDWNFRRRNVSLGLAQFAISGEVRASNIVTVTTATAHGLAVGDSVRIIQSVAPSQSMDGAYSILGVPTTTTFTVMQLGPDETATTPGIYILGFIRLPDDFGELESCQFFGIGSYEKVTPQRLTNLRSYPIITGFNLFFAIVSSSPPASASSPSTSRIELYPVPTQAIPTIFIGTYMRTPDKLVAGTDVPAIPPKFMPLFRRLCRAWAISDQISQEGVDWNFVQSHLPQAFADDAQEQNGLGQIRTRMTSGRDRNANYFFPNKPIASP